MPPRKKARVSRTTSPTPTSQAKTPTPAVDAESQESDLLGDPWTDAEETGLFKGLIKWKPTGIHKHFRLLQLHQFLIENNYIHPANEHTKPPGIWRKLQTLYDLDALDQREDARQLSDLDLGSDEEKSEEEEEEDVYSLAANKIHNDDFALPSDEDAELARMMWERRLASAKSQRDESPMSLPELNLADEPPVRFTPTVSVEPAEAATPASRTGRGTRGGRGRPRSSLVPGSSASTRRSARQAESVAPASEKADSEEEDDEDDGEAGEEESEKEDSGEGEEGENEEDSSEEEEEEEEEASAASTPARRSSRSTAGRGRGRPVGRPRGRGRGRGK